jgi:PAS domain S-box-containing protein
MRMVNGYFPATGPRRIFPLSGLPLWSASALAVILLLSALTPAAEPQEERAKRVLIISTGSRLAPGFIIVDQQLLQALGQLPSMRVEIYAENLDIVGFPAQRYQEIFSEYLSAKYAEYPPDLIILVFVGNLAIPGKLLPELFPATPIIVAGLTEEELRSDQFGRLVSGVAQRVDARANLELILRLQPDVRRVIVVGGTAEIDRHLLQRVKQAAAFFHGRIELEFWDGLPLAQLREAVTALPPQTAILFARMFRDAAGQAVISSRVGRSIAEWANVPVYVMTDASLGTGAVGGSIASIEGFGRRAGELARLVLTGGDVKSLPFEIRSDSVPTFDWRALQRWGIAESRLPPGSVIRFRAPSVWREYRWYIIGALILILLQSAMIVDLFVQRRRLHRVQSVLRESQQLMELATSAGELGLWSRDLTDGDVWANAPARSLFGFGPNEPIRIDNFLARVHSADRDRVLAEAERAQAAGLPFQGEFRVALPDGRERWVLAKGRTIVEPDADDSRRMGVMLDITERKRAEDSLTKERLFLRQVIDTDPNFIFAKDPDGRFTLANQAVADAYGTTVDNLIGKTDADFNRNASEVEFFRRVDRHVLETLQERFIPEEQVTDAHGNTRWLQTVKRPLIGSDGLANQVLGASTDITQRKQTELELRRQRAELAHVARVSLMGELAASLAHELNQPLTAILSNAQAALRFMSGKQVDLEEVREILHDIVKDNSRAGEVIRRMRALVKKEELEFQSVDLRSLIADAALLVHSDAVLHNVAISLDVEDNLPPVRGDRVQLQQVALNILLNAFDAMKECSLSERKVGLQAKRQGAHSIVVSVSDSGPGLTADKLDKVFQPFFTTKGEGLGMGLSICRSIIESHGGRLWAENNPDRGATFYFTLPTAKAADEQGASNRSASAKQ